MEQFFTNLRFINCPDFKACGFFNFLQELQEIPDEKTLREKIQEKMKSIKEYDLDPLHEPNSVKFIKEIGDETD